MVARDSETKSRPVQTSEAISTEGEADRELVDRFLAGEKEAFEGLMLRYQAKIFNLSYRFMNDRQEAEELTQEVFFKVYRKLSGFRGDAKFSTWLFQVAVNHCRNRLKYLQRRKRQQHESLDQTLNTPEGEVQRQVPDETRIPEDLLQRRQTQQIVADKISTLPEEYRTVIVLRDIQGLSYEEIAQITGTVEGTVKSRLHRARNELRERLQFLFNEKGIDNDYA